MEKENLKELNSSDLIEKDDLETEEDFDLIQIYTTHNEAS